MKTQAMFLLLLIAALTATSSSQGLVWESVMSGGPAAAAEQDDASKSYYMPKMFKQTDGSQSIIVRIDKEMIYNVNHEEKTYSELTFAQMEEMMKKMNATLNEKMEELKKQMADMPEEQRKAMEGMMAGQLGGEGQASLRRTGEKKTISGYACAKYILSTDGKDAMILWTTKDVPGYATMANDMKEFGRRMVSLTPRYGKGLMEAMKNLEGFPIQQEFGGMTSTVRSVTSASTPKSEFEPPAGFKKVPPKSLDNMNDAMD